MRSALLLSVLAVTASAGLLPRQLADELPPHCLTPCAYFLGVYDTCGKLTYAQGMACLQPICQPDNWAQVISCVDCLAQAAGVPQSAYMDSFEKTCLVPPGSEIDAIGAVNASADASSTVPESSTIEVDAANTASASAEAPTAVVATTSVARAEGSIVPHGSATTASSTGSAKPSASSAKPSATATPTGGAKATGGSMGLLLAALGLAAAF